MHLSRFQPDLMAASLGQAGASSSDEESVKACAVSFAADLRQHFNTHLCSPV
ncbi:hypothetical protein H696_04119 [Fonticula alba]|uniref:Uncharacterized protein n=1 Tax=Fonticula alba TaxID=691883 RepID=A0A058Z852_FONAL|nr:hypothetical protein H696_04119 [Fonticula alba]KCV69712.1 hypothetical protein H696_04119 [Fonticula alba]|eukprot:XP_009496277.1 hypothetical protein H696_04119 [Fonticula alba]